MSAICGSHFRLDPSNLGSALLFRTSFLENPMEDCRWSVSTAFTNQSIVLHMRTNNLRTTIFESICLDYIKVTDAAVLSLGRY